MQTLAYILLLSLFGGCFVHKVAAQQKPKRATVYQSYDYEQEQYTDSTLWTFYQNDRSELDSAIGESENLRLVYGDFVACESCGPSSWGIPPWGRLHWNESRDSRTQLHYRKKAGKFQLDGGRILVRNHKENQLLGLYKLDSRLQISFYSAERFDSTGFLTEKEEGDGQGNRYIRVTDSLGRMIQRIDLHMYSPENQIMLAADGQDTASITSYVWFGDSVISMVVKEFRLEGGYWFTWYSDLVWADSVVRETLRKDDVPDKWLTHGRRLLECKWSTIGTDTIHSGGFKLDLDSRYRAARYTFLDSSYQTFTYYDDDNAVKSEEYFRKTAEGYIAIWTRNLHREYGPAGRLVLQERLVRNPYGGSDGWERREKIVYEY